MAGPVQGPDHIADLQIFYGDRPVRGIDACLGCQADRTGSVTGNALLNCNLALAIDGPFDGEALLFCVGGLQLELVPIPGQFELDGVKFLVVAINEQFLGIGKRGQAAQPVMGQDSLEFFRVGLDLRESFYRQLTFIIAGNRVEVRIAEEKIRELSQQAIFQLGRREGRWQTRNGRRGRFAREGN